MSVDRGSPQDRDPVSSIWGQVGRPLYPPLLRDREVDVAVVGGGIVGLTTAVVLARAGCSVALLEARRIGDGTTGRSTAKVSALQGDRYRRIVSLHGLKAAATYATAQSMGFDWIEQQVGTLGIGCDWERRSAVTYSTTQDGARNVTEEAEAAAAAGLPVTLQGAADLPFPTTAAVVLNSQAQFAPVPYLEALAAELDRQPAASVHEGTRVTAIKGRGPHRVVTDSGVLRAESVVVATLTPITDRALVFARAKPTASYTIAVRVDGEPPPDQYLSLDEPTRSIRTAVHRDERIVLVGGEGEVVGRGPLPSVAIGRLEAWAREHLGAVEVLHAWSAHDMVPVDHLPWVGSTSPLTPRVLTASGFGKWGLTMGTASALMLGDHILGHQRSPDAWRLFDPGRVTPRSWPSVAKINGEVAARLLGDWVSPSSPPDEHGDGRRYRDGLVPAGDPDVAGDQDPVRVVCTHLGGVCRWNDLERTWDCPLHGSRFEADGTVVAGPAVKPLSRPR